jgi:tripartite-type tricarboxylate transporter receptor subunit TctC
MRWVACNSPRFSRATVSRAAAAVLTVGTAFHAAVQSYPANSVRNLVPYATGSTGGPIAAEVARSETYGYTALMGTTGSNVNVPSVYESAAGLHPLNDLVPVTLLASMPHVLVTRWAREPLFMRIGRYLHPPSPSKGLGSDRVRTLRLPDEAAKACNAN